MRKFVAPMDSPMIMSVNWKLKHVKSNRTFQLRRKEHAVRVRTNIFFSFIHKHCRCGTEPGLGYGAYDFRNRVAVVLSTCLSYSPSYAHIHVRKLSDIALMLKIWRRSTQVVPNLSCNVSSSFTGGSRNPGKIQVYLHLKDYILHCECVCRWADCPKCRGTRLWGHWVSLVRSELQN